MYFRWRLVIHGGVDGFSRFPVYLKVSNNNRADTVLSAFIKGVQLFGMPSRVRSDKGGENVLVAEYMLQHQQAVDRPFIAGRSVHNQRLVNSAHCPVISNRSYMNILNPRIKQNLTEG